MNQGDVGSFTASAQWLADFVTEHSVAHVLGTHIEENNLPCLDCGRGAIYQPDDPANPQHMVTDTWLGYRLQDPSPRVRTRRNPKEMPWRMSNNFHERPLL